MKGPNKTALANLSHDSLRELVQSIRISGVARQQPQQPLFGEGTTTDTATATAAVPKKEIPLADLLSQKTGYETSVTGLDAEALAAELDELDFDGLDDDDDDVGDANDELDALEDDDFDLR